MLGEKFNWSSVPGATSYEFQLKNLKTNELALNISVEGTSLNQVPVLFSGTRYRWWVRARSAEGVYSLWTGPKDFIAGGQTTVLTPTGTTSNTTPLFSWLAVEGAVKYELLLRRDDVTTVILNKKDILTNSYTSPTTLAAGNYRVWIRAINANGIMTTWSAPQAFTITSVTSGEEPTVETRLIASLLSDDAEAAIEVPVLIATTAPEYRPMIDDHPENTPAEIDEAAAVKLEPTIAPEAVTSPFVELIDLAISAWTHRDVDQV
jgi:hypothetical protein